MPVSMPRRPALRPLGLLWLAAILALPGCGGAQTPAQAPSGSEGAVGALGAASTLPVVRIDAARLNRDLSVLAHDSMEGRRVGTPGNARARAFLVRRLEEIGVEPLGTGRSAADAAPGTGGYGAPFDATRAQDPEPVQGVNLVGRIPGTVPGGPVILL